MAVVFLPWVGGSGVARVLGGEDGARTGPGAALNRS